MQIIFWWFASVSFAKVRSCSLDGIGGHNSGTTGIGYYKPHWGLREAAEKQRPGRNQTAVLLNYSE